MGMPHVSFAWRRLRLDGELNGWSALHFGNVRARSRAVHLRKFVAMGVPCVALWMKQLTLDAV
jgi:hypothetical protein